MSSEPAAHPQSLAVIWRRHMDNASFESARLIRSHAGSQFNGTILAAHENRPLEICYQIFCDLDWRTREVVIQQRYGFVESNLKLSADEGAWTRGSLLPELTSCIDVDIEFTPATNALPINRLNLGVGESAEIQVAWIRVPSLAIVPARQRYERLSTGTYRYASVDSGFQADIEVDAFGLAIRYGNIWERIGTAS
jgi:hypothetical protein